MDNMFMIGGKVMEGYINTKTVLFGNFSCYDINSNNIYDLMMKLNEFEVVPTVLNEFEIEILNNRPQKKPVNKLELISEKKELSIVISKDNILIQAIPKFDEKFKTSHIDIDNFITNSKNIFKILLDIMKVNGWRVSLITNYLNEEKSNNGYENYSIIRPFFKGKDIFEWTTRAVARDRVEELNNEYINIVNDISRVKGVVGTKIPISNEYSFDGVINGVDINTIPENTKNRIDSKYISDFLDIAISKNKELSGGASMDD